MLTLVIGGAASGKSEYAESLVLKTALPRYYLATMQVWDAECAAGAGADAAGAILRGLDILALQCENLIVVSNEVFSGGADYAGDTDRYLLALAQVNNALAARADNLVRVVCGIPVYYKGVEP